MASGRSIVRSSSTWLAALGLLATVGCSRSRRCYDDSYYGYGDYYYYEGDGYYDDSGYFRYYDTGYYNYENYRYTAAEIGIGTTTFIEVPPGQQVSPELDPAGRYFNVALRAYGLEKGPVRVDLAGWVGDQLFAQNSYDNVYLQCRPRRRALEVGSLRLQLDPSLLPPQTEPPAPAPVRNPEPWQGEEPVWRDTGDTGFYVEPPPRGDFRVTATITEKASEHITEAQTVWFVYR